MPRIKKTLRPIPRKPVQITLPDQSIHRCRKLWAYNHGRQTPLGFIGFICCLFDANEIFYKEKTRPPLTDEQILSAIILEFPSKATSLTRSQYTINYYRGKFNRGDLRRTPFNVSFRYNSNGVRVEGKYGKTVLTPEKILTKIVEVQAHLAKKAEDEARSNLLSGN